MLLHGEPRVAIDKEKKLGGYRARGISGPYEKHPRKRKSFEYFR